MSVNISRLSRSASLSPEARVQSPSADGRPVTAPEPNHWSQVQSTASDSATSSASDTGHRVRGEWRASSPNLESLNERIYRMLSKCGPKATIHDVRLSQAKSGGIDFEMTVMGVVQPDVLDSRAQSLASQLRIPSGHDAADSTRTHPPAQLPAIVGSPSPDPTEQPEPEQIGGSVRNKSLDSEVEAAVAPVPSPAKNATAPRPTEFSPKSMVGKALNLTAPTLKALEAALAQVNSQLDTFYAASGADASATMAGSEKRLCFQFVKTPVERSGRWVGVARLLESPPQTVDTEALAAATAAGNKTSDHGDALAEKVKTITHDRDQHRKPDPQPEPETAVTTTEQVPEPQNVPSSSLIMNKADSGPSTLAQLGARGSGSRDSHPGLRSRTEIQRVVIETLVDVVQVVQQRIVTKMPAGHDGQRALADETRPHVPVKVETQTEAVVESQPEVCQVKAMVGVESQPILEVDSKIGHRHESEQQQNAAAATHGDSNAPALTTEAQSHLHQHTVAEPQVSDPATPESESHGVMKKGLDSHWQQKAQAEPQATTTAKADTNVVEANGIESQQKMASANEESQIDAEAHQPEAEQLSEVEAQRLVQRTTDADDSISVTVETEPARANLFLAQTYATDAVSKIVKNTVQSVRAARELNMPHAQTINAADHERKPEDSSSKPIPRDSISQAVVHEATQAAAVTAHMRTVASEVMSRIVETVMVGHECGSRTAVSSTAAIETNNSGAVAFELRGSHAADVAATELSKTPSQAQAEADTQLSLISELRNEARLAHALGVMIRHHSVPSVSHQDDCCDFQLPEISPRLVHFSLANLGLNEEVIQSVLLSLPPSQSLINTAALHDSLVKALQFSRVELQVEAASRDDNPGDAGVTLSPPVAVCPPKVDLSRVNTDVTIEAQPSAHTKVEHETWTHEAEPHAIGDAGANRGDDDRSGDDLVGIGFCDVQSLVSQAMRKVVQVVNDRVSARLSAELNGSVSRPPCENPERDRTGDSSSRSSSVGIAIRASDVHNLVCKALGKVVEIVSDRVAVRHSVHLLTEESIRAPLIASEETRLTSGCGPSLSNANSADVSPIVIRVIQEMLHKAVLRFQALAPVSKPMRDELPTPSESQGAEKPVVSVPLPMEMDVAVATTSESREVQTTGTDTLLTPVPSKSTPPLTPQSEEAVTEASEGGKGMMKVGILESEVQPSAPSSRLESLSKSDRLQIDARTKSNLEESLRTPVTDREAAGGKARTTLEPELQQPSSRLESLSNSDCPEPTQNAAIISNLEDSHRTPDTDRLAELKERISSLPEVTGDRDEVCDSIWNVTPSWVRNRKPKPKTGPKTQSLRPKWFEVGGSLEPKPNPDVHARLRRRTAIAGEPLQVQQETRSPLIGRNGRTPGKSAEEDMQALASALQRCIKSRGSSRERPHTVDVPKSSGLDTSEHTPKQVWSNLASVRMSLFSPMDPLQNRSHMGLVPLQRTSTPEQSLSHRAELFPTPEFSRHPVRRRSTRHGDTYDLVGEGIQASRSAWPRCGTQLHAGDLNQMHHDDSDSDENRGAVDASFEVRPMFQTGASTGNVEWEDEVETARHAFTKRSRPKTQDRDPILTPVTRRLTHTSATTRRHDILTPVAGTPINFLRRPHSSATVLPESDLTVLARRSTLSREHGLRRQICPCSLHHPTSMEEQGSDV